LDEEGGCVDGDVLEQGLVEGEVSVRRTDELRTVGQFDVLEV